MITASRSQVDGPASSSLTTAVCRFLFGSHRVSGTRNVLSGERKYSDAAWNVRVKSCSCRISPSGTPEMRHWSASSCTRSNVTDSTAFGGASTYRPSPSTRADTGTSPTICASLVLGPHVMGPATTWPDSGSHFTLGLAREVLTGRARSRP